MRVCLWANKRVKIGYNRLILFTHSAQPANAFTWRLYSVNSVHILSTCIAEICESEFVFK